MDASNYIHWQSGNESRTRSPGFSGARLFVVLMVVGLVIALLEAQFGIGVPDVAADPFTINVLG